MAGGLNWETPSNALWGYEPSGVMNPALSPRVCLLLLLCAKYLSRTRLKNLARRLLAQNPTLLISHSKGSMEGYGRTDAFLLLNDSWRTTVDGQNPALVDWDE